MPHLLPRVAALAAAALSVSLAASAAGAAGPGRFGATFTARPSALVSLRVAATDTAGSTVTETIVNAYRTSA